MTDPTDSVAFPDNPLFTKALDALYQQADQHGLHLPRRRVPSDDGDWPLPIAWRALLADWLIANTATVSSTPPADLDSFGDSFSDGSYPLPGGYRYDARRQWVIQSATMTDEAQPSLRLTGREGQLLLLLLRNPDGLSRHQVMAHWDGRQANIHADSKIFETHLYRLRQKLARLSPALVIENGAGGYTLRLDDLA